MGGYTQEDTKLDFDGTPIYKITKHKRTASSGEAEVSIRNDYTYTVQDRLLSETHTIGTLAAELMSYNAYTSIGQLKEKKVGRTQASPLQDIDYTYTIRGWLKTINSTSNLATPGNPQDLFAFRINYTDVSPIAGVPVNYNGNITETSWRTSTDNILRRYSYRYDYLSRLQESLYQIPSAIVPMRSSYDESLKYDGRGNIIKLQRKGGVDNETPVEIDNLTYTYSGERLVKIVDSSNSPQGFNDRTPTNVNDFGYDSFGNLISDANKGIAANGIIYNHLNLPVKITLNSTMGTGVISYIYNASGLKLKKTVLNTGIVPNTTTTTDYLKGFQYKNNVLDFIPTSEGYVKNTVVSGINNYNYVYNYKDHLGNVRVSYTVDPVDGVLKIMEENHYYPYGMKHEGYNNTQNMIVGVTPWPSVVLTPVTNSTDVSYKIKYNGKELQDELGLGWYDYQARNYDPAIGRWFNIDPLAEKSRRWSPYTYCYNNPLIFVDPDGMMPEDNFKDEEGKKSDKDMEREAKEIEDVTKEINDSFKKSIEGSKNDSEGDDSGEGDQDGKKVTKGSAGIKKGDSAETMITKIMKAMKAGDYIDGGDLDFLNSNIGLLLDEATMGKDGSLNLDRTLAGRIAGIGSDAKLTLKPDTIGKMKGYSFNLSGVSASVKEKIYTSGFINDNKLYFYEKGKLLSVPIK